MCRVAFQTSVFGRSIANDYRWTSSAKRVYPCRTSRTRPQAVLDVHSSNSNLSENSPPLSVVQSNVPTTTCSNWMFFDVARVLVKGGTGGRGCCAFLREKGNARGGPAGGSGGRGGSVIFVAELGPNTLARFRGGAAFRADHGANGTGKTRRGECASDLIVPVPVGTIVRMGDVVLADLDLPGARFVAAQGGRGGRGNAAFKTSQNTAPRLAEPGEPGVQRWLNLELKMVADVALVGIPNAGKSTFLRSVSNATPKVADYPFTTIVPNLGVVDGNVGAGMVIADVPGLVEGAHKGVGMGVAFLRHVERCKVVLHIVDGTASDEEVLYRYRAIRNEMELFNEGLVRKKEVVLVNKADRPGVKERWESSLKDKLVKEIGNHKRVALVSAMKSEGLSGVLRRLERLVEMTDASEMERSVVVLGDEEERLLGPDVKVARNSSGQFEVSGWKVARAFQMTNWNYMESIDRFQRILEAIQVNKKLKVAGAKDGEMIRCEDREFEYSESENVYSMAATADGYSD